MAQRPIPPRADRRRSRGQSLVEFTLILPVLIVIVLLAVDLGRVFYAWVEINNAARAGATYAATHPSGWDAVNSAIDPTIQTEYVNVIDRETQGIDCALNFPPPPQPLDLGPNGLAIGSRLQTNVSCYFTPITPLVGNIFGGRVAVAASAIFPIRVGVPGENPPLPPCFGQATVPNVMGDDPATAQYQISLAGLAPVANTTFFTTGQRNVVRQQNPAGSTCAAFGSVVTYFYRP